MSLPTIEDVAVISAMADPAKRNRNITECYHELSAAIASRTGLCANWCTFATWASRQAGETIRGRDLSNSLHQLIDDPALMELLQTCLVIAKRMGVTVPVEALRHSLAGKFVRRALTRSADAVARGNKKVFEEIGKEFARFAATCLHDDAFDEEKIEKFCSGLRAGDPPEGQRYLQQAFARYYHSFFETDAQCAAEQQYLANIEVGLHEQTRLQPEIVEALNASTVKPGELVESLSWVLTEHAGFWRRLLFSLKTLMSSGSVFNAKAQEIASLISGRMRQVLTKHLMTLTLPGNRTLRLGSDLQLAPCPALVQIKNEELISLLAEIDPTPNSLNETRAVDWGNLAERMHYIADLFRCCHEDKLLFEPVDG